MVIIKSFRWYLPNKLGTWALMIDSNRQIPSIIISSEFREGNFSFQEGSTFRNRLIKTLLFLQSWHTFSTSTPFPFRFTQRSRNGYFIIGLMGFFCEFFPWELLFGEVSEGRVRVSVCEFIFPWFIVLIVTSAQNTFQMILTYVNSFIHNAWVAGLSRRNDWAMEDCCNLGNML